MQLSGFVAGPYKTNTYLLATEATAVVVDPGMHASARVNEFLQQTGLRLEAIVLTHGHLDHTREAGDLAHEHHVPVWIHEADAFMLEAGEGVSPQSQVLFDAANMLPIQDLRFFQAGSIMQLAGEDFLIHHAPGHSPGSVVLESQDFAIVGDVIFRGSVGRTDLLHSDPQAMTETLRGPVWQLPDGKALLPGHGPTTVMQAERASNPYLREANADRLS